MRADLGSEMLDPAARPYVGLAPYSEEQARFLTGRDGERQAITANLIASRLTLLYGESGVGKTSILRAGVVHNLRRRAAAEIAQKRSPRFIVVEFGTWRGDPIAGIREAIQQSAAELLKLARRSTEDREAVDLFEARLREAPPPSPHLAETIDDWARKLDSYLLIVLDQFEEYFLYHPNDAGDGTFADEFPRAVTRRDLRANFLVAIREDYYLKLDRFKASVPNLFANALRIPHMDVAAATVAIRKPLEEYNRTLPTHAEPMTIEDELVARVLEEVQSGQVVDRQTGLGTVEEVVSPPSRIELPFLQLVMERLWDEERSTGSARLRLATLERLGGAQEIWQTHLDNALSNLTGEEREIVARIFLQLVTPGGTKIAHTAADLAALAKVPRPEVVSILEMMAGERIRLLRTVPDASGGQPRYEIRHDRLAPAILDWEVRHQEGRDRLAAEAELERQRAESVAKIRAARRRTQLVAAAGVLVSLVAVGAIAFAILFLNQTRELQDRTQEAEAQRLEAETQGHISEAQSALAVDPQRALYHALEALGTSRTPVTEEAVRAALSVAQLQAVIPNEGVVWAARFSPDGRRLVTAGDNGVALIADGETGEILRTLAGHDGTIFGAAFTPDGAKVVTAGSDGTARVWAADTGEELFILEHDAAQVLLSSSESDASDGHVATGAFTADGRRLVTSAGDAAWIWELGSGALVHELRHTAAEVEDALYVNTAAFSPAGDRVLTATSDGVRIFAVESGELLDELDNPYGPSSARSATFSPDGSLIGVAYDGGSIGIFNGDTGAPVGSGVFTVHEGEITAVTFSPDSTRLLSAGDRRAVILEINVVDTADPVRTLVTLQPGASWIDSAQFSPDGSLVVTSHQDGTVRISRSDTGQELLALRGHTSVVWTADLSIDGKRIVTASEDGTARLWMVEERIPLRRHAGTVNSVTFSPDGSRVLTASVDGTAVVWDTTSGDDLLTVHEKEAGATVSSAAYSDDGDAIITTDSFGVVAMWDALTGTPTGTCCFNAGWAASGAIFFPDRRDLVLVTYADRSARIWNLAGQAEGLEGRCFGGDAGCSDLGSVEAAAVSPDGARIAIFQRFQKKLYIYDADSGDELLSWELGLVSSVGFSPDGDRIVSAGRDGAVHVWRADTGEELMALPASGVNVATFGREDGSWIVAGDSTGTITIWEAEHGHLLGTIRAHAGEVTSIAVSDDGRIATSSVDATATVSTCDTCGSIDEVIARARAQYEIDPVNRDPVAQ